MKSGLWILIAVIVVGIIVGSFLRNRIGPPEEADEMSQLREIQEIGDPETRIARLEGFISDSPESKLKSRAYSMIAKDIVQTLNDTTRLVDFARKTIEGEEDADSKAIMYYWLYKVKIETDQETALGTGRELLARPIDVSWIYNYIGYDLAERALELDLALSLCEKAVALAESREDSASYMDSRGWVYYKKGMYEAAVADLEKATDLLEEPFEEMLRHLAYAALKGGQDDKAFDTFKSILVMGEYDYARDALDSLMDVRGYSPEERAAFEESVWETRLAMAEPAEAFELPTIQGDSYMFDPSKGAIAVVNFMSPT